MRENMLRAMFALLALGALGCATRSTPAALSVSTASVSAWPTNCAWAATMPDGTNVCKECQRADGSHGACE